jgi:signal transduction histidine kinase
MSRELKQVEAALAHDLNNYLQVIMGNLELLKRRQEYVPQIIEAALQATRRAAQLADRVAAVGRLQPPQPRRLDVNRLLGELEPLMARTVGERIRVQLSLAVDLPAAQADPHAVQVALVELATNARAAMPGGGRLAVRTALAPDGQVMIEFGDNGPGIPAEKAQALDPREWTVGERPAGLGLPVVGACLRGMGGRAGIAADHSGTRVQLYLPAAP